MNLAKNSKALSTSTLPHGEEIRLIDSVLSLENSAISCLSKLEIPEVFCRRDSSGDFYISAMSYVEFVAQAAAIGKIMEAEAICDSSELENVKPKQGAIVRARGFGLGVDLLPRATQLKIDASWLNPNLGAFQVSGRISLASAPEKIVSTGSLTIVEF